MAQLAQVKWQRVPTCYAASHVDESSRALEHCEAGSEGAVVARVMRSEWHRQAAAKKGERPAHVAPRQGGEQELEKGGGHKAGSYS